MEKRKIYCADWCTNHECQYHLKHMKDDEVHIIRYLKNKDECKLKEKNEILNNSNNMWHHIGDNKCNKQREV